VHPHHVIRVTELLEQSLIQSLLLAHHCYSLPCVYILTFTKVITSQHGAEANNSDSNLDMHYIELYIFVLDLYSNSLNHFIWKRLKVTVCGRLPLSRYANT